MAADGNGGRPRIDLKAPPGKRIVARATSREAGSRPVEPLPVDSRPVESRPVESRPVEPRPVEPRPVESRPPQARPSEGRRAARVAYVDAACQQERRPLSARFEHDGTQWLLVQMRPAGPSTAPRGGGEQPDGSYVISESYPGCGVCRSDAFAVCAQCRRIGCCRQGDTWYTCPHCSHQGSLTPMAIDGLTVRDVG